MLRLLILLGLLGLCLGRASLKKSNAPVSYTITPANRTLCPESPTNPRPSNRVDTRDRVAALRTAMNNSASGRLDAYITLIADDHGTAGSAWDARVTFISGFTGSNGYTIVTHDDAALWTDGRYFLQGEQELDCDWLLMKLSTPGYVAGPQWLAETLPENSRVGAYSNYLSIDTWRSYETALQAKNIALVSVDKDLVDIVWDLNLNITREEKPNEDLFVHTLNFTGETWQDKVDKVRAQLTNSDDPTKDADCFIATILDDVNYLFNLRGNDRTNSMFYGYGIVCKTSPLRLYINKVQEALNDTEIRNHLNLNETGACRDASHCVELKNYSEVITDITSLPQNFKFWVDPTSNYAIFQASRRNNADPRVERSPIALMKAIKNTVEQENFYACNIRDSAVFVEFMSKLEDEVNRGEGDWSEVKAAEGIKNLRREFEFNRGISFSTIAGSGPNGAVIHYRPTAQTDRKITKDEMLLFDTGGQYLDGTTDLTRTLHFGTPKDIEREAYTRVLMGVIDLATTVWPAGLYGSDIDVRARTPLWQNGWDYNHGTGHGIGYFLSVHEGPGRINIGFNSELYTPLYEGMFFSDEPGYYEDGEFGVRLETLVGVVQANTTHKFGGKTYLTFKPAAYVPFEPKLIKYDLLSDFQKNWLTNYHADCLNFTGNYLRQYRPESYDRSYKWLQARVSPDTLPSTPGITGQPPTTLGNTASALSVSFMAALFVAIFSFLYYS